MTIVDKDEVESRVLFRLDIVYHDGCWLWLGHRNKDGYGMVRAEGRYLRVHRVVYELFVSPIPAGQHVLHSCDNPPCCNPKHLSLGSHDDNMRDMAVRGRAKGRPGIMHNCVKLTEDQVREIRSRWLVGGETQQAIADAYGVSQSHVSEIVSGKYWKALK